AGPYSGSLLAHLGADVVKIESTQGDVFRDTGFIFNRGMRSISLDLKSDTGRGAFRDSVESADAVFTPVRPGVLEQLGIDYASRKQAKPDIVSVSLSAYGEFGPLAKQPGFDMVVQAMSGMMTSQGGPDCPAVNTLAIVDFTSAVVNSLATVTGLLSK